MFTIQVTGSPHRQPIASRKADNVDAAIAEAFAALQDIHDADKLHRDEVERATEFWTRDEIAGDIKLAGQCDIALSGGYYCVEIRAA